MMPSRRQAPPPVQAALAALVPLLAGALATPAHAAEDARLREVQYDPRAIVTIPVKRGVVALVELAADESITEVAAGLGGDCGRPEAVWCIAAQPGGRHIFVKAKSGANASNNLAVVTDRRTHAFRFDVLPDADVRQPVYRIAVRAPQPPARPARLAPRLAAEVPALPPIAMAPARDPEPSPAELVARRMQAAPQVVNSSYSLAEGKDSQDIVPTLVFDDGRFTYLKLPGNRELPAAFQVLGDESEVLVNTRMEGDLLIVDRVAHRLVLRAGSAVVALWNDAFDIDGQPTTEGTSVPGVRRVLRGTEAATGHAGANP